MSQSLRASFRNRYLDVVGSIYIYNEYRGYTSLDRVLAAARRHCADDPDFIAAVARHRADERKHYLMFKRWFELRGLMPLAVDTSYGHIDRFIHRVFGCGIDQLDTDAIVADPGLFEKLCRVIVLTEQRGLDQVEELLRHKAVLGDPVMHRIFRIVHEDEPSHFLPYRDWLTEQGGRIERWNEKLADWCIHKVLLLGKMPALFFDAGAPRLERWPDAGEPG
ncbi:ferritin-like domain-containing protein [Novosphingobium sp. G106]|uniref:ferritin-like domain-containing protein n=1 Tax=Novosphingobium sp. G106 TaxID=2849500 RepID=UPI001C2D4094|nr:ferritin-like domain-containing protein [Novosphingobium sp. G106]MBV1690233.1 ferritin-like domain-containing protein [Novosphingobium sp. G106]